ncbi:hypothetical protein HanRHA438_Chr13g0601541 [Helianthus annuus]|uniref:PH domain-containing protein n=1 Tax=Helianthus annuus TaxID=4232 RepID=A0A9K3HC61_HELAN|nr:hypothetical protein HanXRQr2_Chr13g0590801 [Helianthus annuus]KAJ0497937.1 hypothetical protein HanHA89_Chr13g0516711 [Helianthus annuus]KAJ0663943.1 hypothetical protein HanLR1_Chr13g0486601 [Helianthus annuus]KAJ0849456.1 hypothetical protein HanPSC8_Chr13g0568941 [Helianthus annuus]KAJ0858485.1 hypothetical protein HanRHA438_Chr13g0601541 [Helianthus annuus]
MPFISFSLAPWAWLKFVTSKIVCISQGLEPTVENFRVFYQLSTLGFFSLALCNVKKILINPPKSFHYWKMKFFFIREEVIPIAMEFRQPGAIPKEDTPISKKVAWYDKLMATPNRVFGEQVLAAAGMSDKWPEQSKDVPMLQFNGEEAALYQSAFQTFSGTMGVRPLRDGKECWYEQIKPNFMFALVELFANPPVATEGVRIPNLRPCRAVTSAGKEIVYLSSEEFVASSKHELSFWDDVFAGVLRDLRIDTEKKKTKKVAMKKKVTVTGGATSKRAGPSAAPDAASKKGTLRFRQSNLEDFVVATDTLEGLHDIGEKPQSSAVAAGRSSGSVGLKGPDSGATPS